MPESRDRLRREEAMPLISPRRPVSSVWIDTEEEPTTWVGGRNLFGSPMGVMGTRNLRGSGAHSPLGSPWRYRIGGQENRPFGVNGRRARARAGLRNARSQLPNWYPRRPLQDVTPIISAIERRRSRFREDEQHQHATPLQQQVNAPASQQEWRTPAPDVSLEHNFSLCTPLPIGATKNFQLPAHLRIKTLQSNQDENEVDFVTPQKKLLNSIDQVEKVMKEEFKRMKRTPVVKMAERDNKVRTLMAMR